MSSSVLRNVIHPRSDSESSGRAGDFGGSESEDMELVLGVLIENAPVAMAMFDRSMRYMLANRQWINEFGLQHVTPLVGKSQYEIFPSLHPGWRQVYDRALQGHVVRSEHDALSDTDGRQVVYRWEVRPWRRERDATVGGLMVTCERFSPPLTGGANSESGDHSSEKAAPIKELVADPVFESTLPTVVLNQKGIIERANRAAVGLSLARGIREGISVFWDVFSPSKDSAQLRSKVQEAVEKLRADILPSSSEIVRVNGAGPQNGQSREPSEALSAPLQWLLSPLKDSEGNTFLAVGLPHAPAAESVKIQFASSPAAERTNFAQAPVSAPTIPGPSPAGLSTNPDQTAEIRRLKEELARAHQEIRSLQDVEGGFLQKDTLQRQILDSLPCGILVLDSKGVPVYQNRNLTQLLGRPIEHQETVEAWLSEACPNEAHREQVTNVWREDVWRRQLTRTVSLATADGLLKEVELQPISLPDGELLINLLDVTESSRHEEQLLAMEAKFRALLQENPVPVILMDKSGAIFEVNHAAEELLMRPKSELRRHSLDTWLEADSAKARREALSSLKQHQGRSTTLTVTVQPKDKPPVEVELGMTLVRDASDEPHCTIHFLHQAHSGTAHAPALAQDPSAPESSAPTSTEQGYEEVASEVSWLKTNLNGRIISFSEAAAKDLGLTSEQAIGRPLHSFFRPSDATGFYSTLFQAASSDSVVSWPILNHEGEQLSRQWKVQSCGRGGYDVELIEIAKVSRPTAQPAAFSPQVPNFAPAPTTPTLPPPPALLIPDRTWPVADLEREQLILSETHHRIKNHLQILSSLLNLQSNSVVDQDARMALRSSQNRVRAIAALHQQLYEASLGGGENFSDFAHGLVHRLRECYSVPQEQVDVQLDIQAGRIEQEWLVPLALTLNETISNCFEHAFPENRHGQITAKLHFTESAGELNVSDDGMGLDSGFNARESTGLGLKILAVFASQLKGHFSIHPNSPTGTSVDLRFPIASADI